MVDKTIGLLSMEKMDNRLTNSVGSSRIRIRWLLPYWEEAEEYGIAKKYDVMIFQKVYWAAMMDAFEGVKILDLCDPDWLENRPVFEFIDRVDAVTTSTQSLADYIKKVRPNALVRCIPDRINLEESVPIKKNHPDAIKTVVWFGYSSNAHYLQRTYEELLNRGVRLVIISDSHVDVPLTYRGKIDVHNMVYNYATLNKEITQYDAVLLPNPIDDEKSKYKSNNKTLQAWALGMPVIKVPDDFDRLKTKESRIKEVEMRLQEIKDKWDVKYSVEEYRNLIDEIKKAKGV